MKKIIILIVLTLLIGTFSGCTEVTEDSGQWVSNVAKDDYVTFTQEMIDCAGDDIEDIFASLIEVNGILIIFWQEIPGDENTWHSWMEGEPHNSLEKVQAGEQYLVKGLPTGSFQLVIEKC